MEIRIETTFVPLVFALKSDKPEGVSVFVPPVEMHRSIDAQDVALAIITTIGFGVPTSVLANWLYEKLKGSAKSHTTITINRKQVYLDLGEITRVIEEQVKIEQDHFEREK